MRIHHGVSATTIVMMAGLLWGCATYPSETGDSATATTCIVPRLAAAPERIVTPNAPGNPPIPVLTDAELRTLTDCVRPKLVAAFTNSESPPAREFGTWRLYSSQPFGSEHGSYLEIFGNAKAAAFGRFEDAGVLPEGAILAKSHFSVTENGTITRGPLLMMEKMPRGFDPEINDWRFRVVAPDGTIAGETQGRNAAAFAYCADCHKAGRKQDFLMFVPPQYRRPG
jgi:hypothetical protein